MGLVVTQRPSTYWNAVRNPVIYRMTRKDIPFNQINDSGGKIQIQINTVDISGEFADGDILWIESDNGVYSQQVTVATSAYSTHTLVTCDEDYTSSATNGYINHLTAHPNHKIEVQLFRASDDTLLVEESFKWSTNPQGLSVIDVSMALKSVLSPDNSFDLTSSSPAVDTNYVEFYIKYRETWTGSTESYTDDVANQFHAILAGKQIPSLYGGSMRDNLVVDYSGSSVLTNSTFDSDLSGWNQLSTGEDWAWDSDGGAGAAKVTLTGAQSSKILSQDYPFQRGVLYAIVLSMKCTASITYTVGFFDGSAVNNSPAIAFTNTSYFPQLIYFIPDKNYESLYIQVSNAAGSEDVYITSVNGILAPTSGGQLLTRFDALRAWKGYPFIISTLISSVTATGGYIIINANAAPNVQTQTNLTEESASLIPIDTTNEGVKYLFVRSTSATLSILSNALKITISSPCNNPFMLMGRNSLGGVLQWLFDINQEYSYEYDDGSKAKRYILQAQSLTANEWEALHDFFTLGQVFKENIVELTSSTIRTKVRVDQQVYRVFPDGSKIGVIVLPTTNTSFTKRRKHTIELEVEMPEIL